MKAKIRNVRASKMGIRSALTLAFTALCIAAPVQLSKGTTYYFSTSQGNDANAGTSTNASWKNLNTIYNQSIHTTSSTNPFAPGDSILLKAGDTFYQPIWIYANGASNAPITIGRYGLGANPLIYGDNPNATWSAVAGHAGVYWANAAFPSLVSRVADFTGTQYTKMAAQGTNTLDGWLGTFSTNMWGYTSTASTNIYLRTSDGNPPPQMHLFQAAGVQISADYVTIQNLDVRNANQGIVINGRNGCTIKNNSVQDVWNIGIYGNTGTSSAEIASNLITRCGWTTLSLVKGGNNWVHHNALSCPTNNILGILINGKELCGIGLQQGTNNLIESNTFSNITQSCVDYWLEVNSTVRYNYGVYAGGAAYPDGTGLKVYNNIFVLNPQSPTSVNGFGASYDYDPTNSPAAPSGKLLIYNNIVFGFTGYGIYFGANYSNVVYRNNIFVTGSTNAIMAMVWQGVDMDYNLYYCTGGRPRQWTWNNKAQTTLAAFQTASGLEFHGIYANPQFVSDSPIMPADFKLKATSPCVDTGQDLKTVGLLSPAQVYKDYIGTDIPVRAPDVGPYERTLDSASGLGIK